MTSYVRRIQDSNTKLPTEYVRVSGPYYVDTIIGNTLIPFTYDNGVLDIANIDNFNAFVGMPLMNVDIGQYNLPLYKLLGGSGLVRALGPNFVRYIKAWRSTMTAQPVTRVELFSGGIMTKVQRSPKTILNSGAAVRIETTPPSSDLYIEGADVDDYRATWIFKKPLTITTVEDDVTKYITFSSTLY